MASDHSPWRNRPPARPAPLGTTAARDDTRSSAPSRSRRFVPGQVTGRGPLGIVGRNPRPNEHSSAAFRAPCRRATPTPSRCHPLGSAPGGRRALRAWRRPVHASGSVCPSRSSKQCSKARRSSSIPSVPSTRNRLVDAGACPPRRNAAKWRAQQRADSDRDDSRDPALSALLGRGAASPPSPTTLG